MKFRSSIRPAVLIGLTLCCSMALGQPGGWHWTFDEPLSGARLQGSGPDYSGNFTRHPGVNGQCLNFDGFTTFVANAAEPFQNLKKGFTVEAWIAPQEYSWGWTGILDQAADTLAGFSFGINYLGQIGFQAFINGKWIEMTCSSPVPLLQWSHVAGVFIPDSGFKVFIDGKMVIESSHESDPVFNPQLPLVIGKSQRRQYPALTERKNSKQFLSTFYFDGLMDEIQLSPRIAGEDEIAASFQSLQPKEKQPLRYRVLPSGPPGVMDFGAYYTRLQYCPEWDRLWPVGDYADVVVSFYRLPVRMIFWRGTGYCPAWVSSNGKWVADQGPESWNWNTVGCFEQMSDKQCRYSHVRIIENNDARVVVHWRTASPGIDYSQNHVDPTTGWGEWTDEYYYIYPDAVAVRYQEIHSSDAANMEWQQSEILNPPGTRPQDNVDLMAATLVNMDGETETWSWEEAYGKPADGSTSIQNGMIQVINLKSPERHFVIGEEGASWKPFTFGAREGFSTIPCWNHWPVAQLPNEGRVAPAFDRPSSACVGTLYPVKHQTGTPGMMMGRNLYGMTGGPAAELAALARSWNFAPELTSSASGFQNLGYDKNQRAYRLKRTGESGNLRIKVAGSRQSPVCNLAIIVENWGENPFTLSLNGKELREVKDYSSGRRKDMNRMDLVLWIAHESEESFELELNEHANGKGSGRPD